MSKENLYKAKVAGYRAILEKMSTIIRQFESAYPDVDLKTWAAIVQDAIRPGIPDTGESDKNKAVALDMLCSLVADAIERVTYEVPGDEGIQRANQLLKRLIPAMRKAKSPEQVQQILTG